MSGSGENDDTGFMRRHFPDARPVPQNRRLTQRPKPAPHKRGPSIPFQPEPPVRANEEHAPGTEEILSYRTAGIQNRVMLRLRRGTIPVEASLDLHGLTVHEAHAELSRFIRHSCRCGRQCVLVIHGKGLSSRSGIPVLKLNVSHWLQSDPDVLAYHSARRRDGGAGALYVLLRHAF